VYIEQFDIDKINKLDVNNSIRELLISAFKLSVFNENQLPIIRLFMKDFDIDKLGDKKFFVTNIIYKRLDKTINEIVLNKYQKLFDKLKR